MNLNNKRNRMAVRTVVVDDLDQSEGAETVYFALADKQFEIDLTPKNKALLEKSLQPYIEKARKASEKPTQRKRHPAGPQMPADERRAILAWAKANGKSVAEKGRIAQSVVDEYKQSLAKPKPPTPSTVKP